MICPEQVAIDAHQDWKEGLYYAAAMHQNKKVAELLPSVYEDFLMKKEMGIALSESDTSDYNLAKIWTERILKGREICGEPRDFDY